MEEHELDSRLGFDNRSSKAVGRRSRTAAAAEARIRAELRPQDAEAEELREVPPAFVPA